MTKRKKRSSNPPSTKRGPQRTQPKSPTPSSESVNSVDSWHSSSSESSTTRSPTPELCENKPTNNSANDIKTLRIPPILIQTCEENPWRKIAKNLYSIQGLDKVSAKTTSIPWQIQLNCPEETSFRLVQKFLTEKKIDYHTFALPQEKYLKIAIKGIPIDVTEDELSKELFDIGFEPNFIRAFQKGDKRIPIHMVSLKRSPNVKDIFTISNLFYVKVIVEPYRSSGPAQCFSCQRFGHSSLQCGHTPRCVKCGNNHASSACTKDKDTKATCCNCNGDHTANYRGCPSYTEIVKQKSTQIQNSFKKNKPTEILSKTYDLNTSQQPASHKTYSAVTKNTTGSHNPDNIRNTLNPTTAKEPTISATQILKIIKQLLSTIQDCVDNFAKETILSTIMSIIDSVSLNQDG